MMNVVGVHGVGNHLPELSPEEAAKWLSTSWSAALARSMGVDAALPLNVAN
jgi:hypothetical protein